MTDHFTCPSCGWPQGPVAQKPEHLGGNLYWVPPPDKVTWRGDWETPLAAPQGQEEAARLQREWDQTSAILESIGAGPLPGATIAKEGEALCNHFPGQTECDWCRPRRKVCDALPMGLVAPDDTVAAQDGSEAVGVLLPGGGGGFPADRTNPSSFDLAHKGEYSLSTEKVNAPDIAGLVERLREWGTDARDQPPISILHEAADALERMGEERATEKVLWERYSKRLLNELTAAKAEIEEYRKKLGRMNYVSPQEALLHAENERLREALEKIAADEPASASDINNWPCEIARAALTGKPDKP